MDMKMLLWAQEMMKDEYGKIVIWLVFILVLMAIDVGTGFIQAYANHDLKSGKMSTGLLKKFALLLVLVAIVPLTVVLPDIVSVTVIISVYTLEMVNEFISIVENLNKIGVLTNVFDPIMKRLKVNNETPTEEKPDYGDGQEFTQKTAVQKTNENHLNSESYASGEWSDDIPKGDIENLKPESINYTLSKEETGKES